MSKLDELFEGFEGSPEGFKTDPFAEAESVILNFEQLLSHNIGLGNISKNMTVGELLEFLKNLKENYLPFQREIIKMMEGNKNK